MSHNGASMYSQFSPRRVWNDVGSKTSPAIIPNLMIEGNLSQTWDVL